MSDAIKKLHDYLAKSPSVVYPENVLAYLPAIEGENTKLKKLAVGMYGMLEMLDKMLGDHDACETPRPLIFGEDKSFKDVMRELGMEADE